MSKSSNKIAEAHLLERCTCPDLGELLTDYMVDLLANAAAEEVEEHLLVCLSCREDYSRLLTLRETAQARKARAGGAKEKRAVESAEVISMFDFKK